MDTNSENIYYLCSFLDEYNINCEQIDPSHTLNLFKVIKINDIIYKIIEVIKNDMGKFELNDILYLSGGIISYYTKDTDGKIDSIGTDYIKIIEKNKTVFYSEEIDDQLEKIINQIGNFNTKYNSIKYNNLKEILINFTQ